MKRYANHLGAASYVCEMQTLAWGRTQMKIGTTISAPLGKKICVFRSFAYRQSALFKILRKVWLVKQRSLVP